jgi:hypothetical protein
MKLINLLQQVWMRDDQKQEKISTYTTKNGNDSSVRVIGPNPEKSTFLAIFILPFPSFYGIILS